MPSFSIPIVFLILSLINSVAGEVCYYYGRSYYCSAGQTCGRYGSCEGLPTYVIISIVSSCILFISLCIRFCIYSYARQSARRQTSQLTRVQVHSTNVTNPRYAANATPIHNAYVVEDSPPSYAASTNPSAQPPKY